MKKRTMIILIITLIILTALLIITTQLRNQVLVRGAVDRFYNFMSMRNTTTAGSDLTETPITVTLPGDTRTAGF